MDDSSKSVHVGLSVELAFLDVSMRPDFESDTSDFFLITGLTEAHFFEGFELVAVIALTLISPVLLSNIFLNKQACFKGQLVVLDVLFDVKCTDFLEGLLSKMASNFRYLLFEKSCMKCLNLVNFITTYISRDGYPLGHIESQVHHLVLLGLHFGLLSDRFFAEGD